MPDVIDFFGHTITAPASYFIVGAFGALVFASGFAVAWGFNVSRYDSSSSHHALRNRLGGDSDRNADLEEEEWTGGYLKQSD